MLYQMAAVWFQSLSGFQVRCNVSGTLEQHSGTSCFNPYRVFKFVATAGYASASLTVDDGFQSLSGFQVRCNLRDPVWLKSGRLVSIPIGFSSSLQLCSLGRSTSRLQRFNPYRVFKFVATPSSARRGLKLDNVFQSLSGFQVRCNLDTREWVCPRCGCFNPYRVFKFVATEAGSRLEHPSRTGFNPYRVFKFVATRESSRRLLSILRCFNPYRVFKFVATKGRELQEEKKRLCFNPYRVFKFVAT